MRISAVITGQKRHSFDIKPVLDYKGGPLAEVGYIPGIAVAKYIGDHRRKYTNLPVERLVAIIKKAGDILVNSTVDGESLDDYINEFTYSTGLPCSVARGGIHTLSEYMLNIDKVIEREVPEHCINVLDSGIVDEDDIKFAISPYGSVLGAIMPGNHPAVHISWITALAMKYSIVVKPSQDDPFTPYKVINSLLMAGLPEELASFIPVEQPSTRKIIDLCDRVIFYGSQQSIDLFRCDKMIPRGPGNSKIYLDTGEAELAEEAEQIILQSILHDGGRRCTNASAVVVKGDVEMVAYRIAEKLDCELVEPICANSVIGCFKDAGTARDIDRYIEANMAMSRDITAETRGTPRLREEGGLTYLAPTVLLCEREDAPLYGKELPFPFVTITKAGDNPGRQMTGSLAVSLINADRQVVELCIRDPGISKIIINAPTYSAKVGDPHDGYLFPYLYRIKSFYEGQ